MSKNDLNAQKPYALEINVSLLEGQHVFGCETCKLLHIGDLSSLAVNDRVKIVVVDSDGEPTGMWVYRYVYLIEMVGELLSNESAYCIWLGVFSD